MRIWLIVGVVVVVLALGAWGVVQAVTGLVSNGPISTLFGQHKQIKSIIPRGGLPPIGRPPANGNRCATPRPGATAPPASGPLGGPPPFVTCSNRGKLPGPGSGPGPGFGPPQP